MDFKWFWRMNWTGYSNDSTNNDYVWNGNDHYVVGCTGVMDSQMMMNSVWHKERSHVPLLQITVICKSSDVYLWERDEVNTSSDGDVIHVVECTWKNHVNETGYV